jgi:hypothetical protein
LTAVRGRRGGLQSVGKDRVPELVKLAERTDSRAASVRWRDAVRDLLSNRVEQALDSAATQEAVSLLLGLTPDTSGQTTERRRNRAAQALGYSSGYLRRSLERTYLEVLAVALASLNVAEAAEDTMRTAVDKLLSSAAVNGPRFVQQALDCGLAPLLRLAQYPEEVRRDFRYVCELSAADYAGMELYRARGEYSSIRYLPVSRFQVVMCRTSLALRRWFDQPSVLSAEFLPLPADKWSAIAGGELLRSRVLIDDDYADPVERRVEEDSCIFEFHTAASAGVERRIDVRNQYAHGTARTAR